MELKELQNLWEEDTSQQQSIVMNEQQISHFIHQQSFSLLARIERALRRKTWQAGLIGLFTCGVAPIFVLDEDDFLLDQLLSPMEMSVITFLMGLVVLLVAYQSWQSRKQLLGLQQTSSNVKNMLEGVTHLLNKLQRLKINTDAVGVPLFGAWLAYGYFSRHVHFGWFTELILFLVIVALIIWVSQHIARSANRYYQEYIDQLQAYREELRE